MRSLSRSLIRYIPCLLPLLTFWLTGVAGLDYGYHWDEPKLLESVRTSVYEGTYLPTFYNYPSMSHNLGILSALPEIVSNIDRNHLNEPVFHGHIAAFQLDNHSVTLRTRLLFLTVTSLTILWVYGLLLRWRDSIWIALTGSCIVAFSWEVAYHARWIAPDSILMQFGALWLLFVVQAYRQPHQQVWLWGSVIVAGLATGTKYPAGLLLIPTLLLVYWQKQTWVSLFQAVFGFALTYLITTPGTLLQPFRFWYDVQYEMWHYSIGHSKHTVNAGLDHLLKNFEYLATVQLSHFGVIALILFLLAGVGVIVLWREDRRLSVIIGLFPLSYLLFMSWQQAMLIRNLLIFVPFMGVYGAIGVGYLMDKFRFRWGRIGLSVGLIIIFTVNVLWLINSAQTITHRDTNFALSDIRAWVTQFPDVTFYATDRVYTQLDDDVPDNITRDLSSADEVLVYLSEIQETEPMPANIPRLFTWQFGIWEANIEYYTWHGDDRIVLLTVDNIYKIGLDSYLD